MFGLSPLEIAIILLVLVLLFGPKKLPELGAGIGKAINNFKKSFKEGSDSESSDVKKNDENKE